MEDRPNDHFIHPSQTSLQPGTSSAAARRLSLSQRSATSSVLRKQPRAPVLVTITVKLKMLFLRHLQPDQSHLIRQCKVRTREAQTCHSEICPNTTRRFCNLLPLPSLRNLQPNSSAPPPPTNLSNLSPPTLPESHLLLISPPPPPAFQIKKPRRQHLLHLQPVDKQHENRKISDE